MLYERLLLINELQRDHRTRKQMADALGISQRTLYYKLERHHLADMSPYEAKHVYLGGWELLSDD